MKPHQIILDCWNAQKEFGKWKCHRSIKPDIRDAIDENIRDGWDVEDMCGAIVNFAACYHNKNTKWTHGNWGLAQFLTRGKREDNRRWIWFTENNYREDEWLTHKAVKEKIKQRRLVKQGTEIIEDARVPYNKLSDEDLKDKYNKGNDFERKMIKNIVPDVLERLKNG